MRLCGIWIFRISLYVVPKTHFSSNKKRKIESISVFGNILLKFALGRIICVLRVEKAVSFHITTGPQDSQESTVYKKAIEGI